MTQEEYRQVVKRINEKIEYIQQGDQKVWEELQPDVRAFLKSCAKRRIRGYNFYCSAACLRPHLLIYDI